MVVTWEFGTSFVDDINRDKEHNETNPGGVKRAVL